MGKIFIAFAGKKPDETEAIRPLSSTIGYWNLQKMDFDSFVERVKKEIQPVNGNITDDRYAQDGKCDVRQLYGEKALFGLLLPTQAGSYEYSKGVIHALNLFSPAFLYPIFHIDDFGCSAVAHLDTAKKYGQDSRMQTNFSHHFRTQDFVQYYGKIFPAIDYFEHDRAHDGTWNPDDWRLCWIHSLFGDLRRYQNTGKRQGTFLKECVDLSIILEALFFDPDETSDSSRYPIWQCLLDCIHGKKKTIGSRLRQRTAVLTGPILPKMKDTIHDLYELRSKYIHGEIFREMKGFDDGSPTSEDFLFLLKCTKYVRYLLIAYTYLYIHRSEFDVKDDRLVPLLDSAILDCNQRKKIQEKVSEILCLLPN